jgi:hypothetical protein
MSQTFTTWAALYASMLDQMASGNASVGMATVSGKQIQWKSNLDFQRQLDYVKRKMDQESGTATRRTLAVNGRVR